MSLATITPARQPGELGMRIQDISVRMSNGDVVGLDRELTDVGRELDELPQGSSRAALRARLDVERARFRWLGLGTDPKFDLASAMKAALAVRVEVGALVDSAVQAEVASTIAGIAYDLGDGASLLDARRVVHEAIGALMSNEAVLEPVTLLSDEAALELRMGHLDRAAELLEYARQALTVENEIAPSMAARAGLAATHHLLARLALRRRARERLGATVASAIEHARVAERLYRELGRQRDVGRVLETRGRLALLEGDLDDGGALLVIAMNLADAAVDLVGLARAAAGLAEVLSAKGDIPGALGLLESSIELNRRKGSPGGLAYDEDLLVEIERVAAGTVAVDPAVTKRLAEVRRRLEAALAIVR